MKKIFIPILLCFLFSACSNDDTSDKQNIVGTWGDEIVVVTEISTNNEKATEALKETLTESEPATLTFTKDGRCITTFNEDFKFEEAYIIEGDSLTFHYSKEGKDVNYSHKFILSKNTLAIKMDMTDYTKNIHFPSEIGDFIAYKVIVTKTYKRK